MELPAIAVDSSFFEEARLVSRPMLQTWQMQAGPIYRSRATGTCIGLNTERVSISRERARNVSEKMSDLSGPLVENVHRKLPETPSARALGEVLHDLTVRGGGITGDQAEGLPSEIVEWAHAERHDEGLLGEAGIAVLDRRDSAGLDLH